MQNAYPDYYPLFHCIADRCRHNCCIGWEIDIDSRTAGEETESLNPPATALQVLKLTLGEQQ